MSFDPVIRAAVDRQLNDLNGVVAAARLIGMGKTQLANYAHPNRGERIPLVVAMQLDAVAGRSEIINTAAALLNYRMEPMEHAEPGDLMTATAKLGGEYAHFAEMAIAGNADGIVTPREWRGLCQQALGLRAICDAILATEVK